MSVTQDYNLLMTWRNLLTARIAFFEPLGTHTTLVREIKAELKLTEDTMAAADASGACGAWTGDYTVITLTRAEREAVVGALARHAQGLGARIEHSQVLGDEPKWRKLSGVLGDVQSAYAKVRA